MKDKYLQRIKHTKSLNTYITYRRGVQYVTDFPTVDELEKLLQAWHGLSANTIKLRLNIIGEYVKYLNPPNRDELLEICSSVRGEIKIPSIPESVEGMITKAEPRLKLIILLGSKMGLRLNEILELKWEDVIGDFIQIRNTKGKSDRMVPIPESIKPYMVGGEGKLFSTTPRTVQRQLQKLGCHPHQLRHFYATSLVRNKVQLEIVREVLGHKSISTTQRYLHFSNSEIKSAITDVIK